MASSLLQVFIRTADGKVFGPLVPASVEMLIDTGTLRGRIEMSLDGETYARPGEIAEVRECFDRALWLGDADAARVAAQSAPAAEPEPAPAPAPTRTPVPRAGPPTLQAQGASTPRTSSVLTPASVSSPPAVVQSSPAIHPTEPSASPVPPVPAEGSLERVTFVRLYALAAANGATGKFRFELSDRVLGVVFRKGNPELVESSHPEDSVGTFLLQQGLLKPEQLVHAEAAQSKFGDDLVATLFGLAMLHPGTAFAPLVQRSLAVMLKAFAPSGRFTFENSELAAQKALPLGNKWGVLGELVRRLPLPSVRWRLMDVMEVPIVKRGGWVSPQELKLTPQETRAFGHFDGVRALSKLIKDHPLDADNLMRVALWMRELDAVGFLALEPARPPARLTPSPPAPSPAAAPTRPAVAPAPPKTLPAQAVRPPVSKPVVPPAVAPPPALLTLDGPQLRARAQAVKKEDFFEILGVPRKTDSTTVKLAYFRLAKLYHPDTVAQDAPPEIAKLKAVLFGALNEAYRMLQDDATRAEYLMDLESGTLGKVDINQIFQAEDSFQRGTILVKARKFQDALKILDEAIKANPDEGEFYAWRGYARFFTFPDRKQGAAEAKGDFEESLRRNERCAPAHYLVGHVAKLMGDNSTAFKHFKRTVELQPDHIDAAREIRMMGSGRK